MAKSFFTKTIRILLGFVLFSVSSVMAQVEENGDDSVFSDFSLYHITDSLAQRDTIPSMRSFPDSLASAMHAMSAPFSSVKSSKKGILETQVVRSSDSSTFDIKNRKAYLFKNGDVTYGSVNLKADYIEIDFANSEVYATGVIDSTGKLVGTPIFSENGQEYRAEKMRYNFDTKKGLIYTIITQEGEGYMHGTVVKKNPDDVMNVQDGWYTTCDLDHPHYGLKFGKAKVIPDNKIVVGPAYMVIEDVPTPLVLPFALIPNKKTRRSGIIIPRLDQVNEMGFGLSGGGYYWYINDYMDLTIIGDIFTRGSWALKPEFKYKKLYKYNGKFNVGYGRNLKGVTGTPSYYDAKDFRVQWTHSQDPKAHPVNRFSANVNIQSSGYSKFNPQSNEDYLTNTYSSAINFSTSFWKFNYSLSAGFTQNTNTHSLDIKLPEMNLSTSQLYPFRKKIRSGSMKWYENIYVKYNMSAKNEIRTPDSMLFEGSFYPKMNYGMKHTIPVGTDFKLLKVINGNFNFNYNEYWYGKTIRRLDYADTDYTIINGELVSAGGEIKKDTIYGFNSTRDFNISLSANTKLYGMYSLTKGPIKAVRHVMTPSLSFRYQPDFGTSFWGNYDTYLDKNGDPVIYSIYEGTVYGGPSRGMSSMLSFELNNNLEMKVASKRDTVSGTKKIKLLDYFKINFGYDFARDSLKWTKLQLSGQTTIIEGLKLSYRGVFDPYVLNEEGTGNINKTEWKANKRLFRFNDANWQVSFDYRLNPETFKKKNAKKDQTAAAPIPETERVFDPEYYIDWTVPWNLMVGYSLTYTHVLNYKTQQYTHDRKTIQSIRVSGDVSLTPKWKLAFSSGYDFEGKQWNYTTIDIYRDLHCWEMSFHWVPFGGRQQWGFQINVKANMLKDLKVTKRKDFRDNIDW